MKAYCLASSSEGNCFIFDFDIMGQSHKIMVECGLPLKTIYTKLNELKIKLSDIEACLITHYHSDHSRCAKELNRLNIPLFASKDTFEKLSVQGNVIYPKQKFRVLNGLLALGFPVEHDAEGSMGFVIKTAFETIIFINDNKRWTCNLSHIKPDFVFIECNYDHKFVYPQISELEKRSQDLAYDDPEMKEINTKLKQLTRNVNAHMSLRGCIKGLHKLDLSRCKCIFLLHLSDRYANEYKFKNEIQQEFGIRTYVAKKGGGIK